MPVYINNINDLVTELNKRIKLALDATQDMIFETVNKHIAAYYNEPVFRRNSSTPAYYKRSSQNNFLNSLVKLDIRYFGNTLEAVVRIDEGYLDREYAGNPSYSGNIPATGLDVARWANDCLHGGTVSGNIRFWDDAIQELGGIDGIYALIRENLIRFGVPIN